MNAVPASVAGLIAVVVLVAIECAFGDVRSLAVEGGFSRSFGAASVAAAFLVTGAVLLGALVQIASAFTDRGRARLRVIVSISLGVAVGLLSAPLFQGPRARELPLHQAYSATTGVLTAIGALGVLLAVERRPRLTGLALIVFAFVAAALDQRVLPGLYLRFHALLAYSALLAIASGSLAVAPHVRSRALGLAAIALASIIVVAGSVAGLSVREDAGLSAELGRTTVLTWRTIPSAAPFRPPVDPNEADAADPTDLVFLEAAAAHRDAVSALPESRPSILLITVDAWRADRGPAAPNAADICPNLHRWAERGSMFTRAYSPAVATFPSCRSILSGRYPDTFLKSSLIAPPTTFAGELRRAGYETRFLTGLIILDKRDERWMPELDSAFDEITPGLSTAQLVERVAGLSAAGAGRKPWFAWIHPSEVHQPYMPPAGFARGEDSESLYDGDVRFVDSVLGPFLLAVPDNTWVILTADHGEDFPREHRFLGHGSSLYEPAIHVPFIVRGPRVKPGRIDAPISLVDLMPTILGMAGRKETPAADGVSLLPAVTGSGGDYLLRRDAIFVERRVGNVAEQLANPMRAMISMNEKIIETETPSRLEAYDLASDASESKNLFLADPSRAQRLRARSESRFSSRMARWATAGRREILTAHATTPARLIALAASTDPAISIQALRELAIAAKPEAEGVFRSATRDDDLRKRAWGAIGLGYLADDSGMWPAGLALAGPDPDAREAALDLAMMRPAPQATEDLLRLVNAESPALTWKPIVALELIGHPAAMKFVAEAIRKPEPFIPGLQQIVLRAADRPRPETPSILEETFERCGADDTIALSLLAISTRLPSGQMLRILDRIEARHGTRVKAEISRRREEIRKSIDDSRREARSLLDASRLANPPFHAAWEIVPGVDFLAPPPGLLVESEWAPPHPLAPFRPMRAPEATLHVTFPAGTVAATLQIGAERDGVVEIAWPDGTAVQQDVTRGLLEWRFDLPQPPPAGKIAMTLRIVRGESDSIGFREMRFLGRE